MPGGDVLYSDISFSRPSTNASGTPLPAAESTYSEVRILKGQPAAEGPGPKEAASNGASRVVSQRAVLAAVGSLLAVLVVALGYVSFDNVNTRRELQALRDNLTQALASCQLSLEKPEWETLRDHCYYFSAIPLSWHESRHLCRFHGADLVKINSWEEQTVLMNRLKEKMADAEDKFWIGLTDSETEGKWLWVDGSLLDTGLTYWSRGEPDNWSGWDPRGEDCVRMGEKAGQEDRKIWFDSACEKRYKSICEKKQEGQKCV